MDELKVRVAKARELLAREYGTLENPSPLTIGKLAKAFDMTTDEFQQYIT